MGTTSAHALNFIRKGEATCPIAGLWCKTQVAVMLFIYECMTVLLGR